MLDNASTAISAIRNKISLTITRKSPSKQPLEIGPPIASSADPYADFNSFNTAQRLSSLTKDNEKVDSLRRQSYQRVFTFGGINAPWKKWITFGLPLDGLAKFVFANNVFLAGVALVLGICGFIEQRFFHARAWNLYFITLCVWGGLLNMLGILSLCVLWGYWRTSLKAVRAIGVLYFALIPFYIISMAVWYGWAGHNNPIMQQYCLSKTVVFNGVTYPRPPWTSRLCLKDAKAWFLWQITWATINLTQVYWSLIIVIWCQNYSYRLEHSLQNSRLRKFNLGNTANHAWKSDEEQGDIHITRGAAMHVVERIPRFRDDDDEPLEKPTLGFAMMSQARVLSATSFPMRMSGAIPIGIDLGSFTPTSFGFPPPPPPMARVQGRR